MGLKPLQDNRFTITKRELYSKVLHEAPRKPHLREDSNFGGVVMMVRGGGIN